MKLKESKLLILLSSIILGFLLASQIDFNNFSPRRAPTLKDYQQVTSELEKVTRELNVLKQQEKALEDKLYEYKFSSSSSINSIDKLGQDLNEAEMFAGIIEVEGPGIVISVNDSDLSSDNDFGEIYFQDLYLVHDADIWRLVWDLKIAGAEAISVNGERIISSTEIFCNGPVVYINGRKHAPPYVVKAIGDPDNLATYFQSENSVYNEFMERKLRVSFRKENNIVIPRYVGDLIRPHVNQVNE